MRGMKDDKPVRFLNIDGTEYIRAALEANGLRPRSGIKPQLDITSPNLPGNTWLK